MPEAEDDIKMEDTESELMIQVIRIFTPQLIDAISYSANSVANHCLSAGLISKECYKSARVVDNKTIKARHLLGAIESAIKIDPCCFGLFLDDVLDKTLALAIASKLIKNMKEQYTKSLDARQWNYQDNIILSMLRRQHQSCSVVREPELIRFGGCLATRRFQRIDTAFQVAIHAGQVENVESAAK
ncbi:MAG: hypothetical protein MJE68_18785, partial [Proteobacteria bacterium]|nr:hypothetical protein [Pseudomonadota bacterium]